MAAQKNIHGMLGLALLLIAEFLLFSGVEVVAAWFYFFAWWSYILIVDSLIYAIKKNSLIMNRRGEFFLMVFWSVLIWTFFEAANLVMENWYYSTVVPWLAVRWLGYGIAYATVLPAIFETTELLEALGLFRKGTVKPCTVTAALRAGFMAVGAFFLLAVFVYPRYCFPLIWGSFIFLLEPVNYRRGTKSLLRDWEKGSARKFYLLLTAGLICGILWEFWNFWATTKWIYTVPFFEELKLFEMPLVGFLGFPPFAVECYVIYNFISIFRHHRGWEEDSYSLNLEKRVSSPLAAVAVLSGLVFCLAAFNAMDKKTVNSYWPSLRDLELVPPDMTGRLGTAGVKTPQELLARANSIQGRQELARLLNVPDTDIAKWMKTAALSQLKGMGTVNANLLNRAGIEDIQALAKEDPATLHAELAALTDSKTPPLPREAIVRGWVREAKKRVGNAG